jgi:streptogramin lyase
MIIAMAAALVMNARAPHFVREISLELGVFPSAIVTGPDGNLWFSTYPALANHKPIHLGVGRMTPSGKVRYFYINHGTYDVTNGPDGRIWFTAPYHKPYLVGAIAMDGTITTYQVPTESSPESIITGPDGNIWFTAFGGSPDIFRMSPNGVILATYSSSDHFAVRLAAGRDGYIWYDMPARVGRISMSGHIQERDIGGPTYIPEYMSLGSDGRMWECDGTYIVALDGHMTPTFYSIPPSLNGTYALAPGAGRDLWATDFAQGALIRVAPDGTMTPYTFPTPNMSPGGVTLGPGGDIWYTEVQSQTDNAAIGVFAP